MSTHKTVTVDGERYEFSDNPSMGTVKYAQRLQLDILKEYLDNETIAQMDGLGEDELMSKIVDQAGFEGVQDLLWQQNLIEPIQTISLALDRPFSIEKAEAMGARDFRELKSVAEEALGGDAQAFFNELGVGTSLSQNDLETAQRQASPTGGPE